MSNNRGEIVIGTLILICLLVWPINWAINWTANKINPPKKIEIPICKTADGVVYFMVKDISKEEDNENRSVGGP